MLMVDVGEHAGPWMSKIEVAKAYRSSAKVVFDLKKLVTEGFDGVLKRK